MENTEYRRGKTAFFLLCSILFSIFYILPTAAHAAVTLGTPNTSALSQGLVGYWPLDGATTNWTTGTTRDLSGQGNNGTLVALGTTSAPVAGRVGQALKFTGNTGGAYVTIPTISIPTAVTASAWVYSSNFNQNGFIIGKNTVNTQWEIFFEGPLMRWRGGTPYANTVFCSIPSNNKWHHIVGTQTGTTGTLYIDGVQCGTGTLTAIGNGSGTIDIGRFNSNYYFNGLIDDVRLYNRALSAQEVALLYATGVSKIGSVSLPSTSSFNFGLNAGLVGYWPLDGATTNWRINKTSDISGNGNTGTLVSMSTSTSSVAGKIGQALRMLTSSYINFGSSTAFDTSTFTLAFWIKIPSLGGTRYTQSIGGRESYLVSGWRMGVDATGHPVFWASQSGGTLDITASSVVSVGKWSHVTVAYNGSGATFYINGVYAGSANGTYVPPVGTPFYFGYRPLYASYLAAYDDLKWYNRALSASEVAQLYSSGSVNLGHSNTSSGTGINSGLVGYWTFDGGSMNWRTNTVADQSGSGNTGTLISLATSTSAVPGKIGQALKFRTGTNVTTSASSNFIAGANAPTTISFWLKADFIDSSNLATASGRIIDLYKLAGGSGLIVGIGSTNQIQFYNGATGLVVSWVNTITTGKWYLATLVYDGTRFIKYFNGAVDGTPDINSLSAGAADAMDIGSYSHGTSGFYKGALDDVRIYNRALSAQQVQQLYLMGK